MPKSAAGAGGRSRAATMNGATASGSGSIPSASWVIVWLPHSDDLVDLGGIDARLVADLGRELARASPGRGACSASSASGSIIVAEIREITSAPYGCWRLSIERTASGWPVLEVEQRRRPPWWCRGRRRWRSRRSVVSPASTSISEVVHDHRGDLEVGAAPQRRPSPRRVQRDLQLEVVHRRAARRSRSRRLVLERRLAPAPGSASAPPGRRITCRPTPDRAPPSAGSAAAAPRPRGRPRPRPGRPGASPPAARRARTPADRRWRSARAVEDLILHFLQVPWPPQVESIATPFQRGGVEERGARGHARLARRRAGTASARGPVHLGRRARLARSRCRRRLLRRGSSAIQLAPHSSWPSRRSAARTTVTHAGATAFMIALVSPCRSAMARKARVERGPVGQAERDVGGAAGHVHAEIVADQPHRLGDQVDRARLGADRHRQRVDHHVLGLDAVVAGARDDLAGDLSRRCGSIGDPSRRWPDQ